MLSERHSREEEVRARFRREALAAARLSGTPHVITVFDVGEHEEQPYIVMEYLEGGSVARTPPRRRAGRARAGARVARAGRRRARPRARRGHRPPRREARQPARSIATARSSSPTSASPRRPASTRSRSRHRARDRGLPLARAGARRACDGCERPLRARRRRVRAADRPPSVRGRHRRDRGLRPRQRARAERGADPPASCPPASTRCSSVRSRRSPDDRPATCAELVAELRERVSGGGDEDPHRAASRRHDGRSDARAAAGRRRRPSRRPVAPRARHRCAASFLAGGRDPGRAARRGARRRPADERRRRDDDHARRSRRRRRPRRPRNDRDDRDDRPETRDADPTTVAEADALNDQGFALMQAGDRGGAPAARARGARAPRDGPADGGVRELQPRVHALRPRECDGVLAPPRPLGGDPGRADRDRPRCTATPTPRASATAATATTTT